MQTIVEANEQIIKMFPIYSNIYNFAQKHCKDTLNTLTATYTSSTEKITQAKNVSNRYKREVFWVLSQSTNEFIEFIEEKLSIDIDEVKRTKIQRIYRILNHLKKTLGLSKIDQFITLNNTLLPFVEKTKKIKTEYILPIYISVKAIMSVSWEIVL